MTLFAPIFAWWLALFGVSAPDPCPHPVFLDATCEQAPPPPNQGAERSKGTPHTFKTRGRPTTQISNGF
ncbi:MAG: hypothetical protein EA397_05045 [Deltaproteobacteria bacterium]|nr:MAG: hypothetical protein EA397_05045 [Deltaproteobacteria bacterium]